MVQANGIDKTQLSNGHRTHRKERIWKVKPKWNLMHGKDENAQLNGINKHVDRFWLHLFRDYLSQATTHMFRLLVTTGASWRSGSCNRPAAPFKPIRTQYGSFGKFDVSDDNSEPHRNADAKKLELCGERRSVKFYKQSECESPQHRSYWEKSRM